MTTNNGQLQTVYYPTEKLIFAEYNPRQLTKDQYKALRDSIERFGLVDPIIVNKHKDRKNIVVGGHQRIRIAQDLGIKDIPCVEVELDADREKELNVRLNRNTGEWDWDALANCFDVGELLEWGFTEDELQFWVDEPTEGLIDDDEVPEVEEAITKQGDLWLLGEHRVLCGDATKKEDVERLMDGQKADMVFTDPPYGIDYDAKDQNLNNNNDYGKIKNDDGSLDLDFLFSDDTPIKIVWGANCFPSILPHRGRWICWYKRGDGAEKALGSPMELAWVDIGSGYDKHYKIVHGGFVNSDGGKRVHPTQKPTKLAMSIFDDYKAGTNIIDYFLGSGSTLIACEKTNRKCYGMEIDPHYCDVIVKRWEEYTGKKAERVEAASA